MDRKCPLCGALYSAPPAISRLDNKTPICPTCGVKQALDVAGVKKNEREEIIKIVKNGYPV